MTPQKHSRLYSPSKASIWLKCYLSTVFNDGSSDESSEVAEFGSECHELRSIQISNALGVSDYEENTKSAAEAIKGFKHYDESMQKIADKYTEFVVSTYEYEKANSKEKPLVLIEQQLDLEKLLKEVEAKYEAKTIELTDFISSKISDEKMLMVILYRYVSFKSYEDISKAVNLSLSYVYKLHKMVIDD